VAQEEYEEAAKLRDKVRAMEKELSAKEGGEAHVQG
jgi:protein-arginine kinase activator protein McsA